MTCRIVFLFHFFKTTWSVFGFLQGPVFPEVDQLQVPLVWSFKSGLVVSFVNKTKTNIA